MRLKSIGSYLTLAIFTIQTNSVPFAALTLGAATTTFSTPVYSEPLTSTTNTPLLDELKSKYRLDDPYRNHRNSDGQYETLGTPVTNSRNLEATIKPASKPSRTLNLIPATPPDTSNPDQTLQQHESQALSIGLNHGAPTGDANGNLNLKYSKKGTRKFKRDENGKLVMEAVSEPVEYVEGVSKEDYVSSEINRNDNNFNADNAYGDENMILNEGRLTHGNLSTGNSGTARAYQAITQTADKALNTNIDENGSWLDKSRDQFEDVQSNTGGFFTSCESTTTTTTEEIKYPGYDEHTCQKSSANNLNFCEVERELRIPIVVEGHGFTSCGVGCFELTMGREGDNYYWPSGVIGDNSKSGMFEEVRLITMNLSQGYKFVSATVNSIYDDHYELVIDDKIAYSLLWGNFSYTTRLPIPPANAPRNWAERGNDRVDNRNITYGISRNITQGVDKTYVFHLRTLVGGAGENKTKIKFRFEDTTGEGFGEIETQYPEGCKDKVENNILAGGGLEPMKAKGMTDEQIGYSFCRFDKYEPLEVGTNGFPQEFLNNLGAMYPGDTGNKTWKYSMAGYRCDPLGGQVYCTINAKTGVEQCYDWDDLLAQENQCAVYEGDDNCSEVSRECTDGWETVVEGETVCYNETVTFQCETGASYTKEVSTTNNTCASSIPCLGGDCSIGETESNDRFIEAAVMSSIVQNADGDRSCTDTNDPTTCRIFEGESEYCSWEVTGLGMDCCEAPGGIDILAYVQTAELMLKTNRMAADGLFGETAKEGADALISMTDGAYTQFSTAVTDSSVWKAVSEPLSSAYNSIMGNATGQVVDGAGQVVADVTAGASEGVISSALASLQQQAYKLVYEMLPEELAKSLFKEGAKKEAEDKLGELALNDTLSSVLNGVMAAYAIYSYIKLALTLLTMCDDNEADMGIKLGQRQCFSVGGTYCSAKALGICYQKRQDYCCYNSILARIIMEQAGDQLNKDMTSCEGLTQYEMSHLDFKKIDLSEWVGLMMEAGTVTTEANERNLTGGGQLVESRCETYEKTDPVTGVVTTEKDCYQELDGGRTINTYGRELASDRNKDRMDGSDNYRKNATKSAKDIAKNLDCSISPRPKVCDFGIEIGGN
jgi:conjugal transfer mating pair stabilization protein TraN|tara:strand:- start:7234 stop:10572 length:3339 start_codon:yes stop_codon:yes gene_type:complete